MLELEIALPAENWGKWLQSDEPRIRRTSCQCVAALGEHAAPYADQLVQLLFVWGPCGCPEDLDGNGVVEFSDLLELLFFWGDCT